MHQSVDFSTIPSMHCSANSGLGPSEIDHVYAVEEGAVSLRTLTIDQEDLGITRLVK